MFMERFERRELQVYDSTAFTTYQECPRKYFYRHILGFVPNIIMPYFAWGSAYHVYRESLDKLFMENPDRSLLDIGVESMQKANEYFTKHMPKIDPESKFAFMTKERFLASMQLAFKYWTKEKTEKKIIVLAVEQSFLLTLPDGTKIAGRADQVVRWNRQVWGRDWKTTQTLGKYYENSLDPNDQFTRYTYAESILRGYDFDKPNENPDARVQGQLVDVLQNSKSSGPTIGTFTTDRTPRQILTWIKEHRQWVDKIDSDREKDSFPMNPKSCRFCAYRSVCTKPSESSMMSELKTRFKVDHWDPNNHGDE